MSDLGHDLRQAFRAMRREAGFAASAILIAGLGAGSTVFSVVNRCCCARCLSTTPTPALLPQVP
jgi:hypothetical protein